MSEGRQFPVRPDVLEGALGHAGECADDSSSAGFRGEQLKKGKKKGVKKGMKKGQRSSEQMIG